MVAIKCSSHSFQRTVRMIELSTGLDLRAYFTGVCVCVCVCVSSRRNRRIVEIVQLSKNAKFPTVSYISYLSYRSLSILFFQAPP